MRSRSGGKHLISGRLEIDRAVAARPGRPTQARAAQITDQILAVAGESFRSKGYDATAMSAIARAVGIPKTTLYNAMRTRRTSWKP